MGEFGEVVLITGTSSGIGMATAIACARAGHRVIATMRNLERKSDLEKAAKDAACEVAVEHLDVTSSSVAMKVRELVLKYGPIYGLVNNAGIGFGGAFEEQSDEDVREQFETNVFGLMSVTRAVLPCMRAARRGRVINISSLSGRLGLPCVSAYAASKHAVEGFSESLRWEVESFGVSVHVVEPGTIRTPIFFGNQRRGSLVSSEGPYATLNQRVEKIVTEEAQRAPHPDTVGERVALILSAASPPFRTTVGRDAQALVTLRRALPDRLFASGVRFYSRYRGA
jgi:NAD(P)-dependent dehydrogenase (short-subunit alcohol dehydrogenase family)